MTQVAVQPLPTPETDPAEVFWRMSVPQYHGMIDAGLLTDDDPVELLYGWLIYKMPKNPYHRLVTRRIRAALERLVPKAWFVESQEPITTDDSEPEPDVIVVQGDPEDYGDRHPGPGDLVLVVEVSDATLQRDQTLKKQLYARAGIPVYWIANLPEAQLEVYSGLSPSTSPAEYRHRIVYGLDEVLEVALPGMEETVGLEVRSLLSKPAGEGGEAR